MIGNELNANLPLEPSEPSPVNPPRAVIGSRIPEASDWSPSGPKATRVDNYPVVNEMPEVALRAVEAGKKIVGKVGDVATTGSSDFDPAATHAMKHMKLSALRRGQRRAR